MAIDNKKESGAERRALLVSIWGTLFMAALGIAFALFTRSEAIMLDGLFSGVTFIMSLLTLKVATLVKLPDDEHFHFGYTHFAPLLNVLKSLVMIVLCLFALLSAIDAMLSGGRPLAVGMAIVYGVIATIGCIAVAIYLRKATRTSNSALVAVDAKSWIIDTLMSGAVLVSFIVGYTIRDSAMGAYLDYLDPALVTLLCLVALPVPAKILVQNAREVLMFAPDADVQAAVEEKFRIAANALPVDSYEIRMLKMGDTLNVLAHVRLSSSETINSVAVLDEMRRRFREEFDKLDIRVISDVVFTNELPLTDRSGDQS